MTASTLHPVEPPSLGTISGGAHRTAFRIYVEDTDAGGVVYHARYLHFCERARTQFLASIGFGLSTLMNARGNDYCAFVVRRADISYLQPARLDDVLQAVTRVARLGGASIDFDQRLYRGDVEVASATIYVCCVGSDGRPRPMPDGMKSKIRETNRECDA